MPNLTVRSFGGKQILEQAHFAVIFYKDEISLFVTCYNLHLQSRKVVVGWRAKMFETGKVKIHDSRVNRNNLPQSCSLFGQLPSAAIQDKRITETDAASERQV